MNKSYGLFAVVLAGIAPTIAKSEEAARCVALDDAALRLACYDELHGRKSDAAVSASSAGSTAAGAAGAAPRGESRDAAADFGLTKRSSPEELAVKSISASIASSAARADGYWVMTLDNGQVWVARELKSAFAPRSGQLVTVRRAALGSYLMTIDGQSLRVARQR